MLEMNYRSNLPIKVTKEILETITWIQKQKYGCISSSYFRFSWTDHPSKRKEETCDGAISFFLI